MPPTAHVAPSEAGPPVVVGITGASGVIFGVRLLEALRDLGVPTHLVATEWGERTLRVETPHRVEHVRSLATWTHRIDNQAAPIASGSHLTAGMVVVPCSANTLAALAHGRADNLLLRAADVTLKERRPLVVVVRETPLNRTHLRNMLELSDAGATIMPPVPGFYERPQGLPELVDHFVGRLLDQLRIAHDVGTRWRHGSASSGGGAENSSVSPTDAPSSVAETGDGTSISTL